MTKQFCDKCKCDLTDSEYFRVKVQGSRIGEEEYFDLCYPCKARFKMWLNDSQG